jgi:uncharacterized protein (TIGR02145 family)
MKKLITLILGIALIYSCSTSTDGNGNSTTTVIPSLTTSAVSSITTNSAISGGTISSDGGATITARGLCWSTSPNPTISLSTITNEGTGTGSFTSSITGLLANTTYYVRAYAANSQGTAYGNEVNFITASPPTVTVTDIDGNTYQTVSICNQIWTKTNLNVTRYRNGAIIPQITDATQWAALTTGAWCYYANTTSNGTTYGKLYNWYAVNDPRGLAPIGYHIPTKTEWNTLIDCLGGSTVAGGKLKETGTSHWNSPNTGATDSNGFTGLPGGWRNNDGTFSSIGNNANWWNYIEYDRLSAWWINLGYNFISAGNVGVVNKAYGLSVRCIKD